MSLINSLFNGEVRVFEDMEYDYECRAANEKLSELLEMADEKIPKDGKIYFSDKIREQVSFIEGRLAQQAFEKGVAFGVRLITESCNVKL